MGAKEDPRLGYYVVKMHNQENVRAYSLLKQLHRHGDFENGSGQVFQV